MFNKIEIKKMRRSTEANQNNETKKVAFVIMPIKAKGTEEYEHFLALYKRSIKPIVTEFGFEAIRADEINHPGLITKDLVNLLAESSLVIADLTNLNPNVYYELGMRHVLRNKGTLLILDESITKDPPFDITPFRCVRFKGMISGVGDLEQGIRNALTELIENQDKIDSPVHEWIGTKFFDEAKKREKRTRRWTTQSQENREDSATEPEDIIFEAIIEAEAEAIPEKIILEAKKAVSIQDLIAFLDCLQRFLNLNSFQPTEREYSEFYYLAKRINARSKVSKAILQLGLRLYPESETLLFPYVAYLSSSTEKEDREKAKEIVLNLLKISFDDKGNVVINNIDTLGENVYLLSLMLDAYHRDGEHLKALEITKNLVLKFENNSVALRNHARALEKTKSVPVEEIILIYQKAIKSPNVSDITARWFASTLEDNGRLVDSIETILFACLLDLDESESFAILALGISNILQPRNAVNLDYKRTLPNRYTPEIVLECVIFCESCSEYGVKDKFLCERALKNIGLDAEDLEAFHDEKYKGGELSRYDRTNFVFPLYEELRSEITSINPLNKHKNGKK